MAEYINLKEADRKIFTSSFDDGLVDIFIACVVLMFAVAPLLRLGDFWSSAVFLPFWGIAFLVLRWVRKKVIKPRAGFVKYGPVRKKKLNIFTGVMLALNVIFFILGMAAPLLPVEYLWLSTIWFSIMVLISFSLAGYFLDMPRYYFYGILLALTIPVGEWLYRTYNYPHHGYPVVFGFATVTILITGVVKLISILREDTLPKGDSPS
jgi:hypothetical protein